MDQQTLERATRAAAWELYPRPTGATEETILDWLPLYMVRHALAIARAVLKATIIEGRDSSHPHAYRPSNGTEGSMFMSYWCDRCVHEHENHGTDCRG